MGTLNGNIKQTLINHKNVLHVNAELTALNDPKNTARDKKVKIEKLEDAARAAIGELKMDQESMRKANGNRRPEQSLESPYQMSEEIIKTTSEPTKYDIEGMLKAVLDRTRPTEHLCKDTADESDE